MHGCAAAFERKGSSSCRGYIGLVCDFSGAETGKNKHIMAKAKNPLFSIAASGSVGKICINANATGHVIRYKPRSGTGTTTPAQIEHRANVATAAAAWNALSPTTREAWKNTGLSVDSANLGTPTAKLKHGYALFLREWIIQQIEAPALPLLPAP